MAVYNKLSGSNLPLTEQGYSQAGRSEKIIQYISNPQVFVKFVELIESDNSISGQQKTNLMNQFVKSYFLNVTRD